MVYKALHRKLKGTFSNLTYYKKSRNERQRIPKGPSNMDNPEKLATQGTQDEDKKNKKHNTICVGHHFTQTNI